MVPFSFLKGEDKTCGHSLTGVLELGTGNYYNKRGVRDDSKMPGLEGSWSLRGWYRAQPGLGVCWSLALDMEK